MLHKVKLLAFASLQTVLPSDRSTYYPDHIYFQLLSLFHYLSLFPTQIIKLKAILAFTVIRSTASPQSLQSSLLGCAKAFLSSSLGFRECSYFHVFWFYWSRLHSRSFTRWITFRTGNGNGVPFPFHFTIHIRQRMISFWRCYFRLNYRTSHFTLLCT